MTSENQGPKLTRRQFLNLAKTTVASAVLAACTPASAATPSFNEPTLIPPTALPPTEMAPLSTPTGAPEASATPKLEITPTPVAASSEPYPKGDGGLILGAGGPDIAETRLGELGAGEDIAIQKEFLYAQITRQGRNITDFEYKYLLNERPDNPKGSSWSMMLQEKTTGKYYWPRLTSGIDAGKMVRSGNLWQYEDRSPVIGFFTLEPIANPLGLGDVQQKLVATDSGWPVVAAFGKDGKAKVWFNADQSDVVQIWDPAASFIPPTANALPVFNAKDNVWQVADTQSQKLTYDPTKQEWVAEATKQAEFELKKAESLKMVSIKLDSPEDFATLPVLDDVNDFDSGKVQAAEQWLIENVLPPADIKLPISWHAEIGTKSGYCSMMFNFISESGVNAYRGVGVFFAERNGKKMLRLGVEYGGGKGQLIHFNFEDPKWWTDPIYMKTLIAAFHYTDVIMLPMIQYGTLNNNQLRQAGGYMVMLDATSTESYSKEVALKRSSQFANDWAKNRQLPEGANKTVFGSRFSLLEK